MPFILSVNTPDAKITVDHLFKQSDRPEKMGIFVAANLTKKDYLSLLRIFHPDVSSLPTALATEISQYINAAKDGGSSPFSSGYGTSSSNTHDAASYYEEKMRNWYKEYAKRNNSKLNDLKSVPDEVWEYYGGLNTFKQYVEMVAHASKNIVINGVTIRVEILARPDGSYTIKEKVRTFHAHALWSIGSLNLKMMLKDQLVELAGRLPGISIKKSWSKAKLVKAITDWVGENHRKIMEMNWYQEVYYGNIQSHEFLSNRIKPMIKFGLESTPEERERKRQQERQKHEVKKLQYEKKFGKFMTVREYLKHAGHGFVGKDRFRDLCEMVRSKCFEHLPDLPLVWAETDDLSIMYPLAIWK